MSESFSFIPRRVARPGSTSARPTRTPTAIVSSRSTPDVRQTDSSKGKGKESEPRQASSTSHEDYAALVHLALSEYALWLDSDLLRRATDHKAEGFVPISHLLQHSNHLSHLIQITPEVAIVKAIKTHLDDLLETRILVSSPVKWDWRAQGSRHSDRDDILGGYEIRRRDWETLAPRVALHTKRDWDAKTVYVEKLSPHFRAVSAICRFVGSLLGGSSDMIQVQNVTLPPHHLDTSDDQPKPKGFAFVTLLSSQSVETMLRDWPWTGHNADSDGLSTIAHEAAKFGFRTISKARWEGLRDEYLAYRERLLDEVATSDDNVPAQTRFFVPETYPAPYVPSTEAQSHALASYPTGCLIFVRNIHPETNKTTLRTLLTSAVGLGKESLDYVDFTKGMDTCFIRVTTPTYAQTFVDHFAMHAIVQSDGLDCAGKRVSSESESKAIGVDLIRDKKEEIYWNKVPEKVRKQAIQKAMQEVRETGDDPEPAKRQRLS